jgi:hypothetical protein
MDNKDYEYIQEEFKRMQETNMKPIKITTRLINNLLNNYNTYLFSELYYDSEVNDEERNYFSRKFTDEEWEEYKKNFDPRQSNNWVDEFSEGNWGITNYGIKKMIIGNIRYLKKYQYTTPNDVRFYMNKNDDSVHIYFYGRDLDEQCDYWIFFSNKEIDKCLNCRKRSCWRNTTCGEKVK